MRGLQCRCLVARHVGPHVALAGLGAPVRQWPETMAAPNPPGRPGVRHLRAAALLAPDMQALPNHCRAVRGHRRKSTVQPTRRLRNCGGCLPRLADLAPGSGPTPAGHSGRSSPHSIPALLRLNRHSPDGAPGDQVGEWVHHDEPVALGLPSRAWLRQIHPGRGANARRAHDLALPLCSQPENYVVQSHRQHHLSHLARVIRYHSRRHPTLPQAKAR